MSLVQSNEKLYIYRYAVDEFKIVNGPSTYTLGPLNVVTMSIEHNYDLNVFPVFKVLLNITPDIYEYIILNWESIKFKVRIMKYAVDKLTNSESLKTEVINATFSTFMDIDSSGYAKKEDKSRKSTDKTSSSQDDLPLLNNPLELFLFNDDYVSKLKGDVNFVLSNANVSTCIAYILSKLGISNVLMSPLDNTKSYSPFVMPEMDGITALTYLDQNYGLYKSGSLIYFGLDRGYILNCKAGCTAYARNEIQKTNFLISENTGNGPSYIGTVRSNSADAEYNIALNESSVFVRSTSGINNVLNGVDAKVVNTNTSSITSSESKAATKNGVSYHNTMISDGDNAYLASTYTTQQYFLNTIISITMDGINIDAISPNKEFSFIFEESSKNKMYKGKYRISSCEIDFGQGPEFTPTVTATFNRAK